MPPASRPRVSWSPPSVGLMSCRVCSVKDMGRAPNLSWSASVLAEAAVKLPVMLAVPAHSDALATGAEITWLSSTMPNWLRGLGNATRRVVTVQKALVPALLKLSTTSFWPVEPEAPCITSEVAFAIWSPFTSAGPRMYLTGNCVSQVTSGIALLTSVIASTLLGLAQLSAASACSSWGVTHAGSLAFFGLAPVVGATVGDAALGVAVRGVAVGAGVVAAVRGVAVGAGGVAAVSAGGKPDLGAVVVVPVTFGGVVAGVVGLVVAVPFGVGVGVAVGAVEAATRTARICSCEGFCREATVAL